jgi:hypothetical protein
VRHINALLAGVRKEGAVTAESEQATERFGTGLVTIRVNTI